MEEDIGCLIRYIRSIGSKEGCAQVRVYAFCRNLCHFQYSFTVANIIVSAIRLAIAKMIQSIAF